MSSYDDVVSAMYQMVENLIDNKQHSFAQGIWNYAEEIDPNLSSVNTFELEFRFVRKCAHVTGLVAGDAVLLLNSPNCPLTIIGKLVGDITQAATVVQEIVEPL